MPYKLWLGGEDDHLTKLSTDDLTKAINDEYAVILENERGNLQKALGVGEKLIALRPRIAPKHGEWTKKLEVHCPQISYETANLYIRFRDNLDKLKTYAAEKNVTLQILTIQEARRALATPKKTKTTTPKTTTPNVAAVEPPDSKSDEDVGKEWLKALAADDLITWLRELRDEEYLRELSEALSKVVPKSPPKIDPLDIPPNLQRPAQSTAAPGYQPRRV